MGQARSYKDKFTDAKRRTLEFLRSGGADVRGIRVTDVRRFLHGSAGEALLAPVLGALEQEGVIEVVENMRGSMVYLRVTDAPAPRRSE